MKRGDQTFAVIAEALLGSEIAAALP